MKHPISNNDFLWWAAIMSVWLPFCVNKHTNILLWLTERGMNHPISAGRKAQKSSHFRSIAGIKHPTLSMAAVLRE